MRGRKPKQEPKPDDIIHQEIECPHCSMQSPLEYVYKDYNPPYYNECPFCKTKYKWSLSKCQIIIPADRMQYITIRIERK